MVFSARALPWQNDEGYIGSGRTYGILAGCPVAAARDLVLVTGSRGQVRIRAMGEHMARAASDDADECIIIKKYANRRLYNTRKSSYITLDDLASMTRQGQDFKVIDAKSEEDITHSVLTQIIMEEESRGETMLPINFLRQLIGMYGNSMPGMVPQYLEASMELLRQNQMRFLNDFVGNPFAEMAKRNVAMFEAASSVFTPGGKPQSPAPSAASADSSDEIDRLRAQVAALQAQLAKKY